VYQENTGAMSHKTKLEQELKRHRQTTPWSRCEQEALEEHILWERLQEWLNSREQSRK
jgi:hypothetical protein